jgi:hypothetical protein
VSFEGRVNIQNAKQTMQSLKLFDPEAEKGIRKRINDAARRVMLSARSGMPAGRALRKWGTWNQNGRDLSYNGSGQKIRLTRQNMRKRGSAFSNYIGIVNPTPGGAIFELTGRGGADPSFLDALYGRGYGISRKDNTSRPGVFQAFDADKGAAAKEIEAAIQDAEKLVQSHLDRLTGE